MKITVDRGRCAQHGQCTLAAPEIFHFGADDELVYLASPPDSLRQAAEDAMDSCPEQAITIEDQPGSGP